MPAALLLLWLGAIANAGAPPDTVVVCPAEFRAALAPWLELRIAEGHSIRVVSNDGTSDDIRARIRAAGRSAGQATSLRYVLLIGGADPRAATDANIRRRSIPAHLEPAKVDVHWGSEPQIATDNWYADLDGDGIPDVAIGRLTVRSSAELAVVVKKIVAYERGHDFRRWRSRINFVAGVGGFGPAVDGVLQVGARQMVEGAVPAGYRTSLTLADWHSPYCPDPRKFHDTTLAGLNDGCWLWVFLGHAGRTELDPLHIPGSQQPVLNCRDVGGLHCASGAPIALFMACYTGAFDSPQRCLADELLRTEGAPVAIVCSSRVTMPYGMTVLGAELLDELFNRQTPILGEALLHAKRRSVDADGPSWDSRRLALDALARTFGPRGADLAAERREHLSLFNLLGDPLLQLHYPHSLTLETDGTVAPGDWLTLGGKSPLDGVATFELTALDDRTGFAPTRSRYDPSDAALAAYQTAYEQANQTPLASLQVRVSAGRRFTARLKLPVEAVGHCRVRAFIAGNDDFALGAADFESQRGATSEAEADRSVPGASSRNAVAPR